MSAARDETLRAAVKTNVNQPLSYQEGTGETRAVFHEREALLLERIHFDDRYASRVIRPAKNRGVVRGAAWQIQWTHEAALIGGGVTGMAFIDGAAVTEERVGLCGTAVVLKRPEGLFRRRNTDL